MWSQKQIDMAAVAVYHHSPEFCITATDPRPESVLPLGLGSMIITLDVST
jgi:hypothetical protein